VIVLDEESERERGFECLLHKESRVLRVSVQNKYTKEPTEFLEASEIDICVTAHTRKESHQEHQIEVHGRM
jgi:hypothetical protein